MPSADVLARRVLRVLRPMPNVEKCILVIGLAVSRGDGRTTGKERLNDNVRRRMIGKYENWMREVQRSRQMLYRG